MLAFAPLDHAVRIAYGAVTTLADLVAPLAGACPAAAAIVLFTIAVRLLMSPLSWAQARGQRRQAAIAPRLRALRERYRHDPARLQAEMVALYRTEGGTPLAGCLPALVQAPFFLVMYRLFTSTTVTGQANGLLDDRLAGVPLGWHPADGINGSAGPVFLIIFAALGALAWLSSRRMRRAAAATSAAATSAGRITNPNRTTRPDRARGAGSGGRRKEPDPGGPQTVVSRLLPLLPYTVLPAAAVVPLAASLYLVATTGWTVLEQRLLHRRRGG